MSTIPASAIVAVIPGVVSAGGNALDLNGLFLTESARVPITSLGSILSFASKAAVSSYFGANSSEYEEAAVYFSGYNNCTRYPGAMYFARYPGASAACSFTATISTTTLTVSAVADGALAVGQTISGTGVTAGTIITALGTGTGGIGTYTISVSQSVGSATVMTAAAPGVAAWLRSGSLATITLNGATGLAALQTITSGTLTLTVDGYAHTISSLDLSAATSYSSAAALIEAALTHPTECSFTGAIAGNVLTVSAVSSGTLSVGQTIDDAGETVPAGTVIAALGTGTGLTGTYILSTSCTFASGSLTATATAPTVTYDSTSGGFVATSGITGAASEMAYATGTLAATLLMTSATGAVISQGAAATTPAAFMNALVELNQNWASFTTMFDPDAGVGITQKLAFAAWDNSQNNRFLYVPSDTDASPTTSDPATSSLGYSIGSAGNGYSGTAPVYQPSNLHGATFICGYGASLDFNRYNGRTNAAFRYQSGLQAGVTTRQASENLKANGYNFMGAYATANEDWTFVYPGQVSGPFMWIDSYFNQIWLNNQLQLALMNLLTSMGSIPYNNYGYGLIETAMLDPILAAVKYGAIRTGVVLSQAQIAEVNSMAGRQIDQTLSQQGYYILVSDPGAQVRAQRQSPTVTLWYMDGQSVQSLTVASLEVL